MFSHMKNVVSKVTSALGTKNSPACQHSLEQPEQVVCGRLSTPLIYHRPLFLDLSEEDGKKVLDHATRPTVTPRNASSLPFNSGYCEAVNAGKSHLNEDCAVAMTVVLDACFEKQCTHHVPDEEFHVLNDNVKSSTVCNDSVSRSSNTQVIDDSKPRHNHTDGEGTAGRVVTRHGSYATTASLQEGDAISSDKTCEDEENMNPDACGDLVSNKNPDVELSRPRECHHANLNNNCRKCLSKSLRMDYFGLFDGHAGEGAALYASEVLHDLLIERLREVQHLLLRGNDCSPYLPECLSDELKESEDPHAVKVHVDSLITGLLQDVMISTDKVMKMDQDLYKFTGGCTALLVLFICGKSFVAGAGDSRAVLCRSVPVKETCIGHTLTTENGDTKVLALPMSQDFTPLTERRRLQYLAYIKPSLLGQHFTRLEFVRRVTSNDLGKKVLHRDYHMTGWSYKEVTEDDLRHPLISGVGKAKRLLATIGVTRGLGDHDLIALNYIQEVPVKPFMSSVPEVRVYDLTGRSHGANDVLIVATDGLWDVMSNEMAAKLVTEILQDLEEDDSNRYNIAAEKLVLAARGQFKEGIWRMENGRLSSLDDISVFVIPLFAAKTAHV